MTEATQALRFEQPLGLPLEEIALSRIQADANAIVPPAEVEAAGSRFKRIGALLGVALVTAGGAELAKPAVAEGRYSGVGPALSGNLGTANQQFDEVLRVSGPNSPLAISVGDRLGITTAAGRAKYITPANIDLRRKRKVSNREFPINTASNGSSPVLVRNNHPTSEVFTVAADTLPSKSEGRTREVPKRAAEISAESRSSSSSSSEARSNSKMEFEIKASVLRRLCENMLDKYKYKKPRSVRVHNSVNIDVAYGIKSDLWAKSLSESSSSSGATVVCPDGRPVSARAAADARAKALAHAAQSITGKLRIQYRGTSYSKFQLKYQQMLNSRINAATATATDTSTSVFVDCGPAVPPPPPPPEVCPPGATMPFPKCFPDKVNNPPTGEMAPPEHLYPRGIGKICVKNIVDLDGDPVKAFGFRVYKANDPQKLGIGTFKSEVYEQAGGAQCRDYEAPPNSTNTQQNLTAEAQVNDGKTSAPVAPKNFILLAEDFGPVN